MAKNFNLLGAWSHFSGENASGQAAKYNKVNFLLGAMRFEKGEKSLNGQRREYSTEQSYLFGGIKYRVDRANGASKARFGLSVLGFPLYNQETTTVKDGTDYLKTTTATAFAFHKKTTQEWKQNGLTSNAPLPQAVAYKLDTKLGNARSVYGDHMDGAYTKPKNLHKYAVAESLKEAKPNLNNASVSGITTGGILSMAQKDVDLFRAVKLRKQVSDAGIRKNAFRVGAFLTVLPFIVGFASSGFAVGPVAMSFAAATAGVKIYDWLRKGKNDAAAADLKEKQNALIGAVQRYETQTERVGPQAQVDQSQIVNAFENLHQTMGKQHQGRKTENMIELVGTSAASIGIGAAMSQGFEGVNWPGLAAGGLGLAHAGSRFQKAKDETDALGVLVERFGDTRQDIVNKKILVQKPTQKPNGP